MKKLVFFILLFLGVSIGGWSQASVPSLNATLENLERLLLSQNPSIQRSRLEVERSKADLQSSQSLFDHQLFLETAYNNDRNNLLTLDPRISLFEQVKSNTFKLNTGLQKNLRSSLRLNTSVNWLRSTNSTPFDDFGNMESPFIATNNALASLGLVQPLLRGKGREVVTANETISALQIEANQHQLVQQAATELLNLQLAYWQYLAAYRIYEIYQDNQSRIRRVLDITEQLVKGDKKPPADLIQVRADLADKEGQAILAEQAYLQAKQNLGRVVGLGLSEIERLTIPLEDFPSPKLKENNIEDYLEIASKNRQDLKALKLGVESLHRLLVVAENDLRPQLDLEGTITYGGVNRGNEIANFLTTFGENRGRQVNVGIGMRYLFPLQNNQSKAAYARQKITIQEQQIILENQERNIQINVRIALTNLELSLSALSKTEEAYNFYLTAFDNEKAKFQNGLTTLINLILFQERLTTAQIRFIQAQRQFAGDYSTLEFETGQLLSAASKVDINSFLPRN
ncbi:MAG: TolC family protein [Bacteroidota bacterium]